MVGNGSQLGGVGWEPIGSRKFEKSPSLQLGLKVGWRSRKMCEVHGAKKGRRIGRGFILVGRGDLVIKRHLHSIIKWRTKGEL